MGELGQKQFWAGRSVLVTGGSGFIGSEITRYLLRLGARVVILDLRKSELLNKAVFVRGDVRDSALMESLYRQYDIQTVYHLAAVTLVKEAFQNPSEAFDTNVRGTWQVLDSFRKAGPKNGQVIITSSDKAYGEHATLPYEEHFELLGDNPYDCSKACADRIAQTYAKAYGVPVCITRCGNVYGEGDLHFSRLIPGAIRSFYEEKPFEVRSDGLFQRDYVYVSDIVAGHIRLAEAMGKANLAGEVFNFGTNRPLKVAEVLDYISSAMQKNRVKPVILNNARNEIREQYLSSEKAHKVLDWKPEYRFEDGIAKTIQWYTDFFGKK